LDAAETFWREWVLSYDLGRQVLLVDRVERSGRRFRFTWAGALAPAAAKMKARAVAWLSSYGWPLFGGIVMTAALWFAIPKLRRLARVRHGARRMRHGRGTAADAAILYARMLELLRRRGFQKPGWLTANEFASSLSSPDLRMLVAEFAAAYHAVRFGGRAAAAPQLTVLLEQLERRH
jgi:hypothetical protein